jgi:hypothetical protein
MLVCYTKSIGKSLFLFLFLFYFYFTFNLVDWILKLGNFDVSIGAISNVLHHYFFVEYSVDIVWLGESYFVRKNKKSYVSSNLVHKF